jgi:L,D-peptidoglycan transpeptidase YkuD (ErfK/YbiS/YcfS/YnhG family)
MGFAAVGTTLVVGAGGALKVVSEPADTPSPSSPTKDAAAAGSVSAEAGAVTRSRTAATADPETAGATIAPRPVGAASEEGAGAGMAQSTIPGVGQLMMSEIPLATRQVILVTGQDRTADTNTVTLWQRDGSGSGWTQVGFALTGRNGAGGWTLSHREGDRTTPIGVFSLTAAGGRLADPGTGLPYEYQPSFYRAGSGAEADPFADAFNYVVAIDYNRVPGHPPSDPTRPLGAAAGGDIWIHVDHASATSGCITVSEDAIEAILRWLSPANHPVIIMGDQATVATGIIAP